MIIRKAAAEIERMARAGEVVAETLALVGEHARPGVTTQELDELADEFIRSRGGTPTFKGYRGYPASICASPNEMVVHGIPGLYALRDGDILSVDVGVTLDGFVADSAYTFPIGEVSEEAERLLEGCQVALAAGIDQCRVGNRLSDISHAIQVATEEQGFSVVRSLVGHGVGRSMHEEPQIPNYGEPGRGPQLAEGMTFAIEPMITAGGPEVVLHDDEWSISSADGSLAAHFEHTVAITADGTADPHRRHERRSYVNDPRIEQYAKLLVETCVDVQPGWQVLVGGSALARPLLEEVSRAVARRGAYAMLRVNLSGSGINVPWALEAPVELLDAPPEIDAYMWKHADALVSIEAPENTRELTGLPVERLTTIQAGLRPHLERVLSMDLKWVGCQYPTPALAQEAEMSLGRLHRLSLRRLPARLGRRA